jgi:hypothetical protein
MAALATILVALLVAQMCAAALVALGTLVAMCLR